MAFVEDSSMFINDMTPGYVRANVGGMMVDALLIDTAANDFSVGGLAIELSCIPSQVTAAVRGTAVVIGAINYKVRETPDISDPGVTVLLLEKA
jgi:hypothetical protein